MGAVPGVFVTLAGARGAVELGDDVAGGFSLVLECPGRTTATPFVGFGLVGVPGDPYIFDIGRTYPSLDRIYPASPGGGRTLAGYWTSPCGGAVDGGRGLGYTGGMLARNSQKRTP